MYKITGADGNQYGPITAEQLRQWVAENRANAQTLVLRDGDTEWRPLINYPELTGNFDAPPAIPAPTKPTTQTSGMAVTGMIMGILTLACCWIAPITGILGIIFSLVGLGRVRRNPGRVTGKGMAITGLILSGVGLFIYTVVFIFIIATGAWPEIARELRHM